MKRLLNLWIESFKVPNAGQRQLFVSERLAAVLSETRLRYRPISESAVAAERDAVLIGIGPWVKAEIEILDALDEALEGNQLAVKNVEVFDLRYCSMADIQSMIPGIGPVYQTPVFARWTSGQLSEKASGSAAWHKIRELFTHGPSQAE